MSVSRHAQALHNSKLQMRRNVGSFESKCTESLSTSSNLPWESIGHVSVHKAVWFLKEIVHHCICILAGKVSSQHCLWSKIAYQQQKKTGGCETSESGAQNMSKSAQRQNAFVYPQILWWSSSQIFVHQTAKYEVLLCPSNQPGGGHGRLLKRSTNIEVQNSATCLKDLKD